jgi:hypothetical protein
MTTPEPPSSPPEPVLPPRPRPRRRTSAAPIALGLALALAAAAWLYLRRSEEPPEPPELATPAPEAPAPEPAESPPAGEAPPAPAAEAVPGEALPGEALPPLAQSDAWVRERARSLSADPRFAGWLERSGLVELFVAVVDSVADERVPVAQLGFLRPKEPFKTTEVDGRTIVDPASFARYDAVAAVAASLDANACARLYRAARPLLEQAWSALGRQETLDTRLAAALRHLLATPTLRGDEALVRPAVMWEWRDPELEGLSWAQKQLLRLGPANAARVRAKLAQLEQALALGG